MATVRRKIKTVADRVVTNMRSRQDFPAPGPPTTSASVSCRSRKSALSEVDSMPQIAPVRRFTTGLPLKPPVTGVPRNLGSSSREPGERREDPS
ncbi:hypothetical protein [Nonomuraea sp. B5E05]|uniref:hypothetical protein n=1 Tax=Nonomuraea sp. B5E05 TaxID=3153569 RepID=UPI0032618466